MMNGTSNVSEAQDFATLAQAEHASRRQARMAPLHEQLAGLTDKQFLRRAKQVLELANESYARLGAECDLSDTTLCDIAQGTKTTLRSSTREKLVPLLVAIHERHELSEP